MKTSKVLLYFLSAIILFSCTKIENILSQYSKENLNSKLALSSSGCTSHPIIDDMPIVNRDADSTEYPTILGAQRTNPYTVANMVRAYNNLNLTNVTVAANNLYVRFLPNSVAQLSVLDSMLDVQNIEMFDAPMDYDVLQEGSYYQDPSIPDSMVTWQYAVVPTTFQAPSGITYQVISQIHIPTDTYVAVETEAKRLASNIDSINCTGGGTAVVKPIQPNVPMCPTDYHWNYSTNQCVCDCCPQGYQWNGTQCVPNTIPPSPPPAPSADQQIPAANITVTDNNLFNTPGVRNVLVVAKRWFKIERAYTDINGHVQFTKHFKHRVKVVVRFKNGYCNIRSIRGIRLWQSLYVIRKNIGVYIGDKSNIAYNFGIFTNSSNLSGNSFWVAATTINAVQEHRDYSTTYGFSAAPVSLNIYITNWGITDGLASTPLFGRRYVQDCPQSFINTFLVDAAINAVPVAGWYVSFFATIARARLDIAIDYHKGDMTGFTSDFIKETEYHELSHASHYAQVGTGWYTNFVNAELHETLAHLPDQQYSPYGTGNNTNTAPIIALGEAWGYHMGHFLADQRYGIGSSSKVVGQGGYPYNKNDPVVGLSSHLNLLEDFDPSRTGDPFHWIPKGLMYDLMDTRNEPGPHPVVDGVSNFTIAQLFNALQSNVTTLQQYRVTFQQQNTGNQTIPITNLFAQYGY